jgi:uncharacterized membrane protein YgcG
LERKTGDVGIQGDANPDRCYEEKKKVIDDIKIALSNLPVATEDERRLYASKHSKYVNMTKSQEFTDPSREAVVATLNAMKVERARARKEFKAKASRRSSGSGNASGNSDSNSDSESNSSDSGSGSN